VGHLGALCTNSAAARGIWPQWTRAVSARKYPTATLSKRAQGLARIRSGNRELSSLNSSTWIPEQRDINRLNAEITKLRRGLASSELEPHHAFPRQFKRQFLACGIDPEHYIVYMEKGAHRLLPNGLHTGSDHWNAQWRRFIDTHKNPTADQFFGHLNLMLKRIPWLKP